MAYLDEAVFLYRKHAGNISSDQERRLSENIQVIENLLRDFPKAEEVLGRRRIHARLAYRYYRLAKTNEKGKGRRGEGIFAFSSRTVMVEP